MLRIISNSLLSLVMVATMLWGGCISCSQFFMFPSAKKSCCNTGKCERPPKSAPVQECKRMPLEVQSNTAAHLDHAAAAFTVVDRLRVAPVLLTADSFDPRSETPFVEHPPPDIQVLNSTFLV